MSRAAAGCASLPSTCQEACSLAGLALMVQVLDASCPILKCGAFFSVMMNGW